MDYYNVKKYFGKLFGIQQLKILYFVTLFVLQ